MAKKRPCSCGCGKLTQGKYARGHRPVEPTHHRIINDQGYAMVHDPTDPRVTGNGYVREHLVVASRALGRPVPETADVHHVNHVRDDNRPRNLVICEDRAYHMLLHYRETALEASGHADYVKCEVCGEFDDPGELTLRKDRIGGYHKACYAERARQRRVGLMGTVHNCRIERRTKLARTGGPKRRTPLRPINPERRRRLREQQFGTAGYREEILRLPCLVSGAWPVDPAHVLGTRAAGAGPEGLAPLARAVHRAFDTMGEERFADVYGVSKADIRAWAREHRAEWEARER